MWTSNTTEPYLSYTIHFVGNNWSLDTRCLQVLYLPKDHNGQNIAEALEGALDSWNLDASRQVCITTDNGSNIACATTTHLGWTRLSCFGHNLNLAIENSIKNDDRVSRALGVCRKLVSTFSHSFKLKQSLSKAQKELDLPCHNLVTDCQTRWGSMQKMTSTVLEQKKAIQVVLNDDRKHRHLIPTWQDINVLESLEAALGPLADFTDMLSAENFATVSAILPVVHHILKKEVLNLCDDDTTLIKDIKMRILEYIENKYSESEVCKPLNLATFVDPRFVAEYIPTEIKVAVVKDTLAKEGTEIKLSSAETQENNAGGNDAVDAPPSKRKKLGSWLKSVRQEQESIRSPEQAVKDEIEQYCKIVKPDADSNPLQWWQQHQKAYPTIAKLAKKYLSPCASSCASERLFSTCGNVATAKRNLLKPEKLNMLVFLAKNLD